MRYAAAVLAIFTIGCAHVAPTTPGRVGYIGASVADVTTTRAGVEDGKVEANPMVSKACSETPDAACLSAIKAGTYLALTTLEWVADGAWQERFGRPMKWWESLLILYTVPIALQVWASIHNLR